MTKIIYRSGNLLESDTRHLIQGVNAQKKKKKMASGVAAAIRQRYPKVWTDYADHADSKGLRLGELIWSVNDPHVVINAVAQEFYGREENHRYVSYDAIAVAFAQLNEDARRTQSEPEWADRRGGIITEVAMPLIGAGLAQGAWEIISAIIEYESKSFQPIVWVLT